MLHNKGKQQRFRQVLYYIPLGDGHYMTERQTDRLFFGNIILDVFITYYDTLVTLHN